MERKPNSLRLITLLKSRERKAYGGEAEAKNRELHRFLSERYSAK